MRTKSKIYLTILISFLLGTSGFTFMTKSLGGHYYIYRKKQFVDKQEHFIRDHSFLPVETVVFEKVSMHKYSSAFNNEVRKRIFGDEDSWKYNIWYSPDEISKIKKGSSITRIFYQEDLNLAFLIRIIKYNNSYYAIKTNIPSVRENFNFARELNIIIFLIIIIFQSAVFLFYSKYLTRKIDEIKLNLNHIKHRDFQKIEIIDGDTEISDISKLIAEVGRETEDHLTYFKNQAREQKEFLRTFGHEIKTPLTIANGYTDFLKKDLPDNSYVEIISNELIRLSKITRKFQDFSAGGRELFIEETSLKDILTIGSIFSKRYRNITYEKCDYTSLDETISCDIELLESLFYNLYSNAFKYSLGRVWTRVEKSPDNISIEIGNDSGSISEEEIKKLWYPFYRLDRDSGHQGSGLGLSIVKDIIMKHQWNISLSNSDNITRFVVTIPGRYKENKKSS